MNNINRDLMAPCGLYCGVCSIYIAHRDDNEKFKRVLLPVYKAFVKSTDDIACTGCLSEGVVFPVCQKCAIKSCVREKGIDGCHQCVEWPCKFVENFPLAVGKKVIKRAIPTWRELGDEKFVEEEEQRYHCPECGNQLFRGAKKCNKCKTSVNVD
ncbi:MAG: hypothetical protein BAJALOKI1v1_1510007 [Promethearchaeota archaeon]|nr:MAG: hypothetical protein BAJALOKI1v1_1510007 [Candidatus Lokiarchaeota archaeon]